MAKISPLTAHTRKRSGSGAINSLRREGLIPGVVYGKEVESFNVRLRAKEVENILHHSVSEHILVNLTIEDTTETKLALIQDVQHNPLTGAILHVDFHSIREDEKIHSNVPLELTGESAGAKAGGLLEHLVHNLSIACLPKDLPEKIEVDVSGLEINGALHVNELKLPEGVTTSLGGTVVVARVAEPRVVIVEEAAAAPAAKGKGKAKAAPAKQAAAPAAKQAAAPAKKK
ncbi:MAG: ribosomal rRNA E-loop binding protein Ctc/L25/TL5 [Verrucomicrobiales bacterium]|nr:ribosomal rRNA E-loop binding protein Ctc/L25/TL5 [Verrucomicrobiales bacterium]